PLTPVPCFSLRRSLPAPPLFPYTTLFRSAQAGVRVSPEARCAGAAAGRERTAMSALPCPVADPFAAADQAYATITEFLRSEEARSEEHTSELRHGSISYAVFCLKKKNSVY